MPVGPISQGLENTQSPQEFFESMVDMLEELNPELREARRREREHWLDMARTIYAYYLSQQPTTD